MKLVSHIILHLAANALAILAADYFIKGFSFAGNFKDLMIAALALTAINTFLRPIVRLVLSPFILLTLGLLSIVINAAILRILDIFQNPLTIEGYKTLLLSTLIISAANMMLMVSAKISYKKE
ncbi:MAG: phage holin family protein [Nanoarchaeota archaeon]|nr:phage holin family protein [Nanoarchaeota archaeon]